MVQLENIKNQHSLKSNCNNINSKTHVTKGLEFFECMVQMRNFLGNATTLWHVNWLADCLQYRFIINFIFSHEKYYKPFISIIVKYCRLLVFWMDVNDDNHTEGRSIMWLYQKIIVSNVAHLIKKCIWFIMTQVVYDCNYNYSDQQITTNINPSDKCKSEQNIHVVYNLNNVDYINKHKIAILDTFFTVDSRSMFEIINTDMLNCMLSTIDSLRCQEMWQLQSIANQDSKNSENSQNTQKLCDIRDMNSFC